MKERRRKGIAPVPLWSKLEPQARRMRRQPTLAESLLWEELRGGRLDGLRFRRQHALGRFIVDFYCVTAGLVIEINGPIHASQRAADAERQERIEALGLTVLRFTNEEVLNDVQTVIDAIYRATTQRL